MRSKMGREADGPCLTSAWGRAMRAAVASPGGMTMSFPVCWNAKLLNDNTLGHVDAAWMICGVGKIASGDGSEAEHCDSARQIPATPSCRRYCLVFGLNIGGIIEFKLLSCLILEQYSHARKTPRRIGWLLKAKALGFVVLD